jgi:hypothetical protein
MDLIEDLPDSIQNIKVYQPPIASEPRAKKVTNYAEQADDDDDDDDDGYDPADYSDSISDEDDAFLKPNEEIDFNNNLNESCSKLRGMSVAEDDFVTIDLTRSQPPSSPLICLNTGTILNIKMVILIKNVLHK